MAPPVGRLSRVVHAARRRWARSRPPPRRWDAFLLDVLDAGRRLEALDDAALRVERDDLRARLRQNGLEAGLVAPAFGLVRAAARRVFGEPHSDVQVIAGRLALDGRLAEVPASVDPVVTATLPACVAGLAGIPVHLVVSTDRRARLVAESLSGLYHAMGITVGVVMRGMPVAARAAAYRCDVTYGTAEEIASDYLLDQLTLGPASSRSTLALEQLDEPARRRRFLLRGLHYAIVDDADRILLDDAASPMAVSGHERGGAAPRPGARTRISRPAFFARYLRFAGIAWTAREASEELWSSYGLHVIEVLPARERGRAAPPVSMYATARDKWNAVVGRIGELHRTGEAVLVAGGDRDASQRLGELLDAAGLPHCGPTTAPERETAEWMMRIADVGRITVAASATVSGLDFAAASMPPAGRVHVIVAALSESARIDRRLVVRGERLGATGCEVFVSLEDDVMVRYGSRHSRLHAWTVSRVQRRAERAQARARRRLRRELETAYDKAIVGRLRS